MEQERGAYVALLRGINVGGKNRLSMKSLKEVFTASGCTGVEAYIQSGNVVFLATERAARELPVLLSEGISKRFGLQVPVLTRTAADFEASALANPFLRAGVDPKTLYVMFLAERPTAGRVATLDRQRSPPDDFLAVGREVYLRLPNGSARSKLTNAYFDSKLATTSTSRNWRTVLRLVEMARVLTAQRQTLESSPQAARRARRERVRKG